MQRSSHTVQHARQGDCYEFLTITQIPYFKGVVPRDRDGTCAVESQRNPPYDIGVPGECLKLTSGAQIPYSYGLVPGGRDGAGAIGRDRHALHISFMTSKRMQRFSAA